MTKPCPITVFVCGPSLLGEMLTAIEVRDGAVVWENDTDPAPQPREPIYAIHHLLVEPHLVLLETDAGLYLATVADLPDQLFPVGEAPTAINVVDRTPPVTQV